MITAIQEIRSYIDSPFSKDKVNFVINGSNDLDERESRERRDDIAEEHEQFGLRLVSVEFLEGLIETIEQMHEELKGVSTLLAQAVNDPEQFATDMTKARLLADLAQGFDQL